MHGEYFVVAECVDGVVAEEAGVMHGTVVDYLYQGLVLVGDGGVVDVDETVGASREEEGGACGVVLELG